MGDGFSVKKGFSANADVAAALAEIKGLIDQPDMSAVILFCTSRTDLEKLGAGLKTSFNVPVIGCTTSGEISTTGYTGSGITACNEATPHVSLAGGISAVSIAGADTQVETYFIDDVRDFDIADADKIGEDVKRIIAEKKAEKPNVTAFGMLLIDGLSVAEESVIANLYAALSDIPIVGGSAGDDLSFSKTHVYHDGKFQSSCAMFAAFVTTRPVKTFKTQHFMPGTHKMVVTAAIPEKRIVTEINGLPAAQEYARFVGLEVDKLEPMTFSKYPVMLKIGGEYYVRSIQKVNEDESLTFYCAIDEGLVLTIANGVDIVNNLRETFADIKKKIPEPKLVIGFECILRRLEVAEKGVADEMARIMVDNNVIGFHTYGEQYNSIHVNQTLTGVAIG